MRPRDSSEFDTMEIRFRNSEMEVPLCLCNDDDELPKQA